MLRIRRYDASLDAKLFDSFDEIETELAPDESNEKNEEVDELDRIACKEIVIETIKDMTELMKDFGIYGLQEVDLLEEPRLSSSKQAKQREVLNNSESIPVFENLF